MLLYTTDEAGNRTSLNITGTESNVIAGVRYNDGVSAYFYGKDIKGSTSCITDSTGNVIVSYDYDDWGQTTIKGDDNFYNQICYTGGVYDELTKLYYLNARYYNPYTGTFMSQDTVRGSVGDYGSWNMYGYCAGNPVCYVDPSGHAWYDSVKKGLDKITDGVKKVVGGAKKTVKKAAKTSIKIINKTTKKIIKAYVKVNNFCYEHKAVLDFFSNMLKNYNKIANIYSYILLGSAIYIGGAGLAAAPATGGASGVVATGTVIVIGESAIIIASSALIAGELACLLDSLGNVKIENGNEVPQPLKKHKKVIGRNGSLKAKGTPNSSVDLYSKDGKLLQRRFYGSDGRAVLDVDFSHGNGDGTHTFPHLHLWDWTKVKPRQ